MIPNAQALYNAIAFPAISRRIANELDHMGLFKGGLVIVHFH